MIDVTALWAFLKNSRQVRVSIIFLSNVGYRIDSSWWCNNTPSPQVPACLSTYRASHTVRTIWARSAGPGATGRSPTWPSRWDRTATLTCAPQTPPAARGMTCTVASSTPFTSLPTTTCAAACRATALQYKWVNELLCCTPRKLPSNAMRKPGRFEREFYRPNMTISKQTTEWQSLKFCIILGN